MKANRAYELRVSRSGIEPAFFADRKRLDRVEVISIGDGEVVLFWELPPKDAAKVAKMVRAELIDLDEAEFIDRWLGADFNEP